MSRQAARLAGEVEERNDRLEVAQARRERSALDQRARMERQRVAECQLALQDAEGRARVAQAELGAARARYEEIRERVRLLEDEAARLVHVVSHATVVVDGEPASSSRTVAVRPSVGMTAGDNGRDANIRSRRQGAGRPTRRRRAPVVKDAEGFDTRPDPLKSTSAPELVAALVALHQWAGEPSYRTMAGQSGQIVSSSTLQRTLTGTGLPSYEAVMAIVIGCGGDEDVQRRYGTAWRRIRSGHRQAEATVKPLRAI